MSYRPNIYLVSVSKFKFKPSLNFETTGLYVHYPYKGGDPAAPSDTATLLRLRPPHSPQLRQLPPEG